MIAAIQAADHASPQSIQDTSQQLGVGYDAEGSTMVAATQSTHHASPQGIQDTSQQLRVGSDAARSALDICNTFEQVPINCARGGNAAQIRQRLQESVVVGRILNIVNASVFRKRSQLYSSQQIQFVGDTFR